MHIIISSDRDYMMPFWRKRCAAKQTIETSHHRALCGSHSQALCISTPAGGSVGRPSCVNVSSRRRARGNSLQVAVSARHSRVAVAGSERSAHLDQFDFAGRDPGEEVDLVALGGPHVGHLAAPALEVEENRRLQGMAHVGPTGSVEDRDQPRVDRIRLAWIDHALAFRRRFHPHDPHEEGVFQVPRKWCNVSLAIQVSREGRVRAASVPGPSGRLHRPEAPVPGGEAPRRD